MAVVAVMVVMSSQLRANPKFSVQLVVQPVGYRNTTQVWLLAGGKDLAEFQVSHFFVWIVTCDHFDVIASQRCRAEGLPGHPRLAAGAVLRKYEKRKPPTCFEAEKRRSDQEEEQELDLEESDPIPCWACTSGMCDLALQCR